MALRADPDTQLQAGAALQTPESLAGQRIDPPSLVEQLAEYERRQAILDEQREEVDPQSAQGVYLLVSILVGVISAAALGAGLVFVGMMLQLF